MVEAYPLYVTVQILGGFERPQEGKITYDEKDQTSLKLSELRRQLGIVLQGAQVFSGTIFENVRGRACITAQLAKYRQIA